MNCIVRLFEPLLPVSAADRTAWQVPVAEGKPVGLGLCWEPAPGNPARNCTLKDGHDGSHFHEYAGVSWRRAGVKR